MKNSAYPSGSGLAFAALPCVAGLLLFAAPAKGAVGQELHGHVPAAAARLKVIDPLPASAFASTNNLKVTDTHPNRLVLDLSGSVADIEKALDVKMQTYQHPKENRTFYAPDVEPTLDLDVKILYISGLDNYSLPHPKYHTLSTNFANVSPKAGSGPGGTYLGYDFRDAYVPGTVLTGLGQTVGLLEFDGYFTNDVAQYLALAGLPQVPQEVVLVGGFNGSAGPGGNVEVSLDIDMAIAMAPGLTKVIVYEAANPSPWVDLLSRMANEDRASQLSCSWGGGPPDPNGEQIFLQMAAQGQSFYDAIGDSDAFPAGQPIAFPGESANITQVGGTTLTTSGPLGSYVSEKVWNVADGVGSSGGVSVTYPIPVWQQGINMSTNKGSTTMRNMPDVALTADNIWIFGDNGFQFAVGGTSAAAPLWAGFTALVNQQALQGGLPVLGFINPAVYAIGKGPAYNVAFHDTVLGDNTWSGSPSLFPAVPAYDLCTGWGSPNGTNLINLLVTPSPLPVFVVSTNFVTGGNGNGVIDPNECNNLSLVLMNVGTVGASGVSVALSTTTPGVGLQPANSPYPNMPSGVPVTNSVPLHISTAPTFVCGTPIDLTLLIKSDQVAAIIHLQLQTGSGSKTFRFDNSTPVPIPDDNLAGTNSVVVVSNMTSAIANVSVSLYITHTFDQDLILQLVSPDGVTNTLSANNGSSGQNYGVSCADSQRTTFDDSAGTPIRSASAPFVGTFVPQQPLSIFNGKSGTSINGPWTLHVVDAAAIDVGTIQCWSLLLSTANCVDGGGECPGADLALGMVAQPQPVLLGNNLTYTISVTNNGPSSARNVVASQILPSGVIVVSATSSQGSVSASGGVVTCALGTMNPSTIATVTVVVLPTAAGSAFSSATVTSDQPDFNPDNNSASVVTRVNPQTELLSGLKSG